MRQPVPFGKYLLLDRISVGGMAEVFKAKSYGVEGFEKIIAIKRILPTMGEDRDFIKMFIDEAKIAGQLAHANICQIFELGRIDGSHFIAMEYIWGKDLLQIQNRLRKLKKQMPVAMACFAIAKVLEGLDYAHRKRDPLGRPLEIVHRDCSPQNVLVSYEGEVKVIDFGIAKATSRNSRTMAGVLKGKFGYMSPEQVRGLPLDRRSDIFALGTMLFECLTGERLFQGETDFSTLEKVRNVDVPAPRSVNPDIPEAVEKVILKALAKDVEDRYQWCSEMLADLQQYLMGQDVVFTAKSLSSWLKETFAAEIERERQQLEQYKRVGRDGLIAGVPAAEAKLDVVEHLGEAGVPEGDSTVLGGPNFDDIEAAAGAAPDVSQTPPARSSKPGVRAQVAAADDDDDDASDFGEEAPTEIFGDADEAPAAAPLPAAGRPPAAPSRPPAAPPRPPTRTPSEPAVPLAASPGAVPPVMRSPSTGMPAMGAPGSGPQVPPPLAGGYQPPVGSAPYGVPPGSGAQIAMGTPGGMPVGADAGQLPAPGSPQKTVLGVAAPTGLGNYGGGYRPSQQQPAQMPYASPPSYAGTGYPPYASGQMAPMQPGPYAAAPQVAGAVDPSLVEGKKSTLVRDIGIGVAIAVIVLAGIFAVKVFVLDHNDKAASQPAPSTSQIATIRLSLPPGITVRMLVDGKEAAAAVRDKDEVPVSAGLRTIKLVGPNNQVCDEPIKLDAGQVTTLDCAMTVSGSGAGSSAGSAAGSAATPTPAAAPGAGSGSGSGSAATKPAEVKPAEPATPEPKASETKSEVKAGSSGTSAKVESETTDLHATKTVKPTETRSSHPDTHRAEAAATKPADDGSQGYLVVESKPQAKILVDGVDTGHSTPISGHELAVAAGKHKVTFVIGDDRFSYTVVVKAGQTATISKDLQ